MQLSSNESVTISGNSSDNVVAQVLAATRAAAVMGIDEDGAKLGGVVQKDFQGLRI